MTIFIDLANLAASADMEVEIDKLAHDHAIVKTRQPAGQETWTVLSADLTRSLLSDPRLANDLHTHAPHLAPMPGMRIVLLEQDNPDHARSRRLVADAFASKAVQDLGPRIVSITRTLLDGLGESGTVDFIEAFCHPMPLQVICELLGVPPDDRPRFRDWARNISAAPSFEVMQQAALELRDYTLKLIADKRLQPASDLLSELLAAGSDDGRALSDEEVAEFAGVLLMAGHETVMNVLGNALHDLIDNPGQLAALRSDASLVGRAVEEALRFRGSAMTTVSRIALTDIAIDSVVIKKGELVRFLLNAANRDTAIRADPHVFDIERGSRRHFAFGLGPHFCLGHQLARQEIAIALEELLDYFKSIELAIPKEELVWLTSDAMRGLTELPIRYSR